MKPMKLYWYGCSYYNEKVHEHGSTALHSGTSGFKFGIYDGGFQIILLIN